MHKPMTAEDLMTIDVDHKITDQEMVEIFRSQGPLLYADPQGDFDIRSGDVFRAQTVKGGYNYVIALRVFNGRMYYGHGDKVRYVPLYDFVNTVDHGDLEYVKMDELDRDKLSLSVIGLDAIANRRSAAESIDIMADSAEEFRQQSDKKILGI